MFVIKGHRRHATLTQCGLEVKKFPQWGYIEFVCIILEHSEWSYLVQITYHAFIGEVELPGLLQDHMLALLPLGALVLQIHPEAFHMFNTWDTRECKSRLHIHFIVCRDSPIWCRLHMQNDQSLLLLTFWTFVHLSCFHSQIENVSGYCLYTSNITKTGLQFRYNCGGLYVFKCN